MITLILSLITAIIGAIAGAYFGTLFRERQDEKNNKKIRDIAIKALNIIRGYAKDKKPFSAANNEFNSKINIAEKRAILVALHKLGIPILANEKDIFDIKDIKLGDRIIDAVEIDDAIIQIDKGHCDKLFFIEVDSYFSSNIRVEILRNIAKRYVNEVLCRSTINISEGKITYPKDWFSKFTYGEKINIGVFREVICTSEYFAENGTVIKEKVQEICSEIDLGIWDNYLMWDYNAYTSVVTQNKVNDALIKQLASSDAQNGSNKPLHENVR